MENLKYSIWDIVQFGDFIPLDVFIDKSIKQDLEKYKDKWSAYNPRRNIRREGLCVLNERGEVGPGPALDSLKQYNKENNTNWNETDFNKPTDLYYSSQALQNLLKDIIGNCVRTHFIKLPPGGFFPPHRDHTRGKQNTFRLIVPIQNANPPYCNFCLENNPLYFEYNKMYFINTTKQHTLFNASATLDSIWLVINAVLSEDTINYVIENLAEQ